MALWAAGKRPDAVPGHHTAASATRQEPLLLHQTMRTHPHTHECTPWWLQWVGLGVSARRSLTRV